MKIAILTDGLHPDFIGGMQKHSTYLVKYLAMAGVHVDVYLREPKSGCSKDIDLYSNAELRLITFHYIIYPAEYYFPGHYLWQSYGYSTRLFNVLKHNLDVDLIYVQGLAGWRLLSERKKGFKTPPIGVNFHGFDMFQRAPSVKAKLQQWMFRPIIISMLKVADVAFSLGGALDRIVESVGVLPRNIYQSPNGVESSWLVDDLSVSTGRRKFIFVGRYARLKGVEELTAVLARMLAANISFEFDFIGPIPDHLHIHSSNIRYHGLIRDLARVQHLMLHADFLVCPSYAEGMPTVILEAMASGLAIVATDVGAIGSLVSSDNGWLVRPGDQSGLFDALLQAVGISDAQLFMMKSNSVHLITESYLWSSVANNTICQITEIVSKYG